MAALRVPAPSSPPVSPEAPPLVQVDQEALINFDQGGALWGGRGWSRGRGGSRGRAGHGGGGGIMLP
jgi:hypothetical protein